jgi:hypothetical protein
MLIPGILASSTLKITSSYESIASATGTGSSGTITFSSIPQTYASLQLRYIGRLSAAYDFFTDANIYFNGVRGTSYAYHVLQGTGSSATAGGATGQANGFVVKSVSGASIASNIMGVAIVDIHNYASTTQNKTVRAFSGGDSNSAVNSAGVALSSSLFIDTTAITSISLLTDGGNWTTDSQFALYGIKGA